MNRSKTRTSVRSRTAGRRRRIVVCSPALSSFAERKTEGVGDRERPRGPDFLRDAFEKGDGSCRDAALFDDLLCKTDGLHAHRSNGNHQKRYIHLVFHQETINHRGQGPADEPAGRSDRTHQRNMPGRHLAGVPRSASSSCRRSRGRPILRSASRRREKNRSNGGAPRDLKIGVRRNHAGSCSHPRGPTR